MSILKKAIFTLVILILISSNILSITNAKFHDILSDLFSKIPISELMAHSKSKKFRTIEAENKSLKEQNNKFKKQEKIRKAKLAKAHKISRRVALRTAKNVSLNVSSVVVESVPYVGVGVILAVTAADVYAGCETIKDNNELLSLFDAEQLSVDEEKVCGLKIPTEQEISKKLKDYKREFNDAIGGTIYEIFN